ncbi:MAG: ABC transporter permease [Phycisphaeraceae bacterium]|nr:ABC transporter permease [Phycisphaeraceae bacterium]
MIRLAIKMLIGSRIKFLGIVAGVLFTSFLSTHFQAIFAGIMTRTFAMISDTSVADIWVMDPAVEYVDEVANLPPPALDRVRSVPGVKWATRLYFGSLRARLPGGRFRSVQVIGLDDASLVGLPDRITQGRPEDLRQPDAVIVDEYSCKNLLRASLTDGWGSGITLDFAAPTRPLAVGDEITINDHRVVVVGKADILPRFIAKGTFFMTYSLATRIAPPERNQMSYVLVKAEPGVVVADLARRIGTATRLKALTADEFAANTVRYYIRNTDIVGQVGLMTLIAILVGTIITGLLLFMFTAENLRYYGMLMAVGATARTLTEMVLAQAACAALIGYSLGIGFSAVLGTLMKYGHLPYRLMWPSLLVTGFFVVLVAAISSMLSVRQALKLEPGIVFRS